MNNQKHNIFIDTISGLEKAFQVRHIAILTPELITCNINDDVNDLMENNLYQDIDQFPVTNADGSKIIGVIERNRENSNGKVSQFIKSLDASFLISLDYPLRNLLPIMINTPYLLVLEANKIVGLVTKSDLLKLPVRLLAFTIIVHLETLMAEIVTLHYPNNNDEWFNFLPLFQQERLIKAKDNAIKDNLQLPLLQHSFFDDKLIIVNTILGRPRNFTKELAKIQKLRNAIDHARDYELDKVLINLDRAEFWIQELNNIIENFSQTETTN